MTDSEEPPKPCATILCLPGPPATTTITSSGERVIGTSPFFNHFLSSFLPPLSANSAGTNAFSCTYSFISSFSHPSFLLFLHVLDLLLIIFHQVHDYYYILLLMQYVLLYLTNLQPFHFYDH